MIRKEVQRLSGMKTPRIGLLGGTFDPVHNAHIEISKIAMDEFGLDQVWLLVSNDPPHKEADITPASLRYKLVAAACEGQKNIFASDYELNREGTTYTVDTLERLYKELPEQSELFYIIGTDTLYDLKNWKRYEDVLKMVSFICIPRPGYNEVESWAYFLTLTTRERARIAVGVKKAEAISSTEIRNRVSQGLPIDTLVPSHVRDLIVSNHLYTNAAINFETAVTLLKQYLEPSRFEHSLAVVKKAEELAIHYGENIQKAKWAALLHDCGKQEAKKPFEKIEEKYGLIYKPVYKYAPQLIHAPLGAMIAKEDFKIDDLDILNAITYHTTGRKEMSLLEKIIYISDYIAEGRHFEGLDELREIANHNLDEAVLRALDLFIVQMATRGAYIDADSIRARNDLWKELRATERIVEDEDVF